MTDNVDTTGVHFVRTKRGPLKSRWQVYAWRGGPSIATVDQIAKPKLDVVALGKLVEAHNAPNTKPRGDTFPALADLYLASPEYRNDLADTTKRDYKMWLERAKTEFREAKIKFFDDPSFRADVIAWRDKWDHAPRQRKYALQVLSALLSWAAERGYVAHNAVKLIDKKHSGSNRADIIWTDAEIEAVAAQMQPHVADAFLLDSWTGYAPKDLLSVRWTEVGDMYIVRNRSKTAVEQLTPLFDQTRAILQRMRDRRAKSKVKSLFVVANHRGAQFTMRGFGRAIERARAAAGVAQGKTLYDLRGTFATRLMRMGFKDGEIDEMLGWETGKSKRIRRTYISRRNVIEAAVERVRRETGNGET